MELFNLRQFQMLNDVLNELECLTNSTSLSGISQLRGLPVS